MRLTLAVDGDTQLDRLLTRFSGRLTDASPAFQAIANRIASFEAKQFDSQGQYGSAGWAPLSPRYAVWKARHYPGKPILERTGRLRESLTSRPFGVERINRMSMEVGTGVPYSRYHQRGTTHMPRRRPLEIPRAERVELSKIMQRYLVRADR